MKYRKYLLEAIVMLFILLWIYAAVSKLMDYSQFKFQLGRSPYVTNYAGFLSVFIPFIEVLIAILLLGKRTTILGIYGSFTLMLLFTGYIYAMLHFSYFVPCSCGGILNKMDWNTHFYFNIGMTIVAIVGVFIYPTPVIQVDNIQRANNKTIPA